MPKGPKGEKRPADVNARAVMIARIATGELSDNPNEGKDAAAVSLGRRGGLKGGKARAAALSTVERSEAAVKAAKARWAGKSSSPGKNKKKAKKKP